ncbi:efflux RND transporter permease subunit [Opitutus sp. ER46]|uniref:efflux RND transporter permease subunit n=1 Tax=Opitutus sp. ER46 TaxID=2161864 RepID=UPI0011B1FE1D|nr:efflux RND transporter permease subunit [Opitutus sp. ER46]
MLSFVIRNTFLTLGAALALAVAGLWAWRHVPVDAIPDLSDNQVIVWAEWPGKSPQDMDDQVTSRLARELQGLPGVQTVRGMSLYGASYVYVIFAERRDLYECRTRVLERLSQLQGVLPEGVNARLGPDATAMGQVYAFTLQGPRDLEHKRYVLDQVVVPALRGVPGVAEVAPAGGVGREYQIDVDPNRLEAQGLTLDMLMMAVQQAGRDVGAMSVEQSGIETMIRGVGFIRSVADVENIVLRGDRQRGAGLRLGDVAHVQLGGQFRQGLLADGYQEHVGAIIGMRVREDPKTVITAVKQRLADLAPTLAREQLSAVAFYDRSQLIRETTETVTDTLKEAIITTVIVVVAFLLHVRASLAVAVSLPLGMLFTFLVMHGFGLGANIMSLAGIAIAIGVMVDFGIIMTENITQHLVDLQEKCRREGRPMPTSPFNAEITDTVIRAAQEVTRPLLTSAATTIIGFLPIFALTDQAGRLFEPLALTKSLAITGAVLFGTLLVPVLCRLLLPPWHVRKPLLLGLAGVAGGVAFAWFIRDGWSLPLDHGRWAITVPGWLFAPLFAVVVAAAIWRLGRERLVSYEENPASHAIHVGYEWAYARILRHKVLFTAAIGTMAIGGYLLGVGWPTVGWPLRRLVAAAGGDFTQTRVDRALTRLFPGVGSSFLPPLDEGSLLFMPSIPATGGLGETQRIMLTQNRLIESVPEVASVMGKMGRAETALDPAPIGMIETVVLLKPYAEWPVHEMPRADGTVEKRPRTLAEVRAALAAITEIPGVAPSWLQPIETRVVMLSTGIRSLIALQVLGDDQDALERFAEAAEKVIQPTPGAADVQMQREGGKPYAEIRLDPAKLARFGLTNEQVMRSVETALGGMAVTYSVEGALRYPVRIRYERERRDDPDELLGVRIPVPGGMGGVPLSSVLAVPTVHTLQLADHGGDANAFVAGLPLTAQRNATVLDPHRLELTVPADESLPAAVLAAIKAGHARVVATRPSEAGLTYTIGPMAIRSEGGKRTQYVLLNARGRGEVEVVRDADARLRAALSSGQLELPAGATYRWVGRYEQKLKADQTLRWIISASMAVMVLLIYLGTRSWLITAIIVLANATVTTAGGFFFVWLWGAEMTTAVVVGFLVLLGVMFNDGILLGTYIQEQFKTHPGTLAEVNRRVFQAGLRRRRPAIMTNATAMLSLIPVLWATGRGSELMQPMVLPVVGGMVFDFVSLFSVPVFFTWYWERRLAREARATTT